MEGLGMEVVDKRVQDDLNRGDRAGSDDSNTPFFPLFPLRVPNFTRAGQRTDRSTENFTYFFLNVAKHYVLI